MNDALRLDSSVLNSQELDQMVAAFIQPGHVALIDESGSRTEIPEPLYRYFMRIVQLVASGRAVVLLPEDEPFTTQAAADFLGVSRQFLVDRLEAGEIPFYRVGTHRRISFKSLVDYREARDFRRRAILEKLAAEVDAAGLYFPTESSKRP